MKNSIFDVLINIYSLSIKKQVGAFDMAKPLKKTNFYLLPFF